MTDNNFPKTLLIYSHINKYCVDVILRNRFAVTDPTRGFNDPLDCYIELETIESEKKELIEQLMGMFILGIARPTAELTQKDHSEIQREKKRLNDLSVVGLNKEFSKSLTKSIRKKLSSFLRIRCFSALNTEKTLNNVVFSHYGDSHRGVCYLFNTEKLVPVNRRQSLTEVKYCCKPPSFISKTDDYSQEELNNIGRNMISVKHQAWNYEREWRLPVDAEFPDRIHETMEFPSNALEGVVLGLKTTQEDEERIITLVKTRPSKLKVYRAIQIHGSFDLKYENNPIFE